ncbi:peptide chain release factor 2 [Psittacicella melopsittaci]|uniref:Peptide chain release factor 2 n=1 Tax=Psittacicella melopsittaci TaxID=2028576 RepID=A0A3A1Y1J1_9GAMM|nr:peptide chain release factor 2 [Psittacicella melopsittaci]RIY32202.1 peptide chain release factor 2 [Psittacicella melopsittaci]
MLDNINIIAIADDLLARIASLKNYFAYDNKKERLEEVNLLLADPKVWDNPQNALELGKEKSSLEAVVNVLEQTQEQVEENKEFYTELGEEEALVYQNLMQVQQSIEELEFKVMFNNPHDRANCYIDFNAGSGGTEAQDWVDMLIRMYTKWAESHSFKVSEIDRLPGDTAGTKQCTLYIEGEYAYGYLRTETGVHRLVRKSPFDANNKRHTSFASVYVHPEIDDSFEVEINPADLKMDVYRSSGAGGQHVNKTESAVRITHIPTGIVVQSQQSRSQHQNREICMKQLKSRLYEMEMEKRRAEQQNLEENKSENAWGSQIRSYVLDDSRIKDMRTGVESSNPTAVLNGDLDKFIEAQLKLGVQ